MLGQALLAAAAAHGPPTTGRRALAPRLLPARRATPPCRSCTTWSRCATAARSPPAGSSPGSTAARSSTSPRRSRCTEAGFEHQDPAPDASRARGLPVARGGAGTTCGRPPAAQSGDEEFAALEVRHAGAPGARGEVAAEPRRPGARLDRAAAPAAATTSALHQLRCCAYASDLTLLHASLVPHGVARRPARRADRLARPRDVVPPAVPRRRVAALRPDRRPSASGARGLSIGRDLRRGGTRSSRPPSRRAWSGRRRSRSRLRRRVRARAA